MHKCQRVSSYLYHFVTRNKLMPRYSLYHLVSKCIHCVLVRLRETLLKVIKKSSHQGSEISTIIISAPLPIHNAGLNIYKDISNTFSSFTVPKNIIIIFNYLVFQCPPSTVMHTCTLHSSKLIHTVVSAQFHVYRNFTGVNPIYCVLLPLIFINLCVLQEWIVF